MVYTFFLKLKLDFSISKCLFNMPNATKHEVCGFIQDNENSKMIYYLLLQKKKHFLSQKLLLVFCSRSFHSYLVSMSMAKSIQ